MRCRAAAALQPLAGELTFVLFALGIIGTGVLTAAVLAAAAGYAVADVFGWRADPDHDMVEAEGLFAMIATSTLLGTLIDFTPLDPIMATMMWMRTRREIPGQYTLTRRHPLSGCFTILMMATAVIGMIATD